MTLDKPEQDKNTMAESHDRSDAPATNEAQSSHEYAEFQNFGLEQWLEWLNAFLAPDPQPPFIATNKEEIHHALIDLYKGLKSKTTRDLFAEAIKRIFQTTPRIEQNAELLYYLLHIISYTVPLNAKDLLRERLHEGVLRTIEYGKQNLQTLLLIANSKYEVDDDLIDYIHRSARASKDYKFFLASLRVLSSRGGAHAYPFIEQLLPLVESETESFQLARQLKSIGYRVGYWHFFDWYRSRAEKLTSQWPQQWYMFECGLRHRLLTERALPTLAKSDPYAAFLSGLVHASLRELAPSTVLTIARLYPIIGKESIIDRLSEIWERGYHKWEKVTWDYLSSKEIYQPNRAAITNARRRPAYQELFFDLAVESELEEIFLGVRERCDPLIARRSVAMLAAG
jgi:hypothetical protein